MNNEMKVNSLRKHQEYVERVKAFNLSDPKSVSEAQKFLENAFKEVLDDFTSIKDRLLVFLMYYDFTKMNEFSYLKPFYGQTYERCFDTEEHIKTYFDLLVNNKELCDNVLENVNNETLKKLYDYSDSINHLFLMNNDKKYQDVYNKISKVCTEKRIVEAPLEIMDDSTLNRQELLKAKENNNISDDFYNAQIEEKRDNIFDKAADALGVKSDNLINFVGDESLKVDKIIIISNELVNTLAANSAIISTKPNNKFNKMLKRISEINKFKGFEFSLVDNILTIKKEDTTLDKIASCSQKVFSTIKNSAIKKKKLAKLVINNTLDSIKNVKSAIINSIQSKSSDMWTTAVEPEMIVTLTPESIRKIKQYNNSSIVNNTLNLGATINCDARDLSCSSTFLKNELIDYVGSDNVIIDNQLFNNNRYSMPGGDE